MVGGVEGLAEREWPGGCLSIGKTVIGVQDLRSRCIMTAYDPDTQVRDKEITRDISGRDAVELMRGRARAESAESTDFGDRPDHKSSFGFLLFMTR